MNSKVSDGKNTIYYIYLHIAKTL